jgi:hypothetical protein
MIRMVILVAVNIVYDLFYDRIIRKIRMVTQKIKKG